MNILHLDSSALGDFSASRQLTAAAVATLRGAHPTASVIYRDLAADPLSHVTGPLLMVARAPEGTPPPTDAALLAEVALRATLIDELLGADVIVVGAPMYNYSVPSTLKAWIDRIVMLGRTIAYTPEGPKGLAGGRRVIIASTRGGNLFGQPHELAIDHQEAFLKAVFGTIGIEDIAIVRAEGLVRGDAVRADAMQAALKAVAELRTA